MSKKARIILLSILLSVFVITLILIAIFRPKPEEETPVEQEHNYAYNETHEQEEEPTEEPTPVENKILTINDVNINHIERLTPEQSADKTAMVTKLDNRTKYDVEDHGKVISEEIADITDESHVYIDVSYADGAKLRYICTYDPKSMHSFLRCVSIEEWESIQNGDNAG